MVLNASVAPGLDSSSEEIIDDTNYDASETLAASNAQSCDDLLNDLFDQRTTDAQVLQTAKILRTLIVNASDPNASVQKQRVRLVNARIKTHVVDIPGAMDILRAAGFVDKVHEHQEWLFFEPDQEALHVAMVPALAELVSQLESPSKYNNNNNVTSIRQRRTRTNASAVRRKERDVDRWQALRRWKDDQESRTTIRVVKATPAPQRKSVQTQQPVSQQASYYRTHVLPYLEYIVVGMCVLVALRKPKEAFNFGLQLFVLYWIAVLFAGLVGRR